MRLNLKRNELEGLNLLLTESLQLTKPVSIPDKLMHDLTDKLNERLRAKVHKIEKYGDTNYGIKLNTVESYALIIYLINLDQSIQEMYEYEVMVANRVVMELDKEYA